MGREILSTARPTRLRLAGFLCLALGGLLLGFGATRNWAVVGFPGDTKGTLDLPWKGTDVWEGTLVLAAGVAVLILMVAMRLLSGSRGRMAVAGVITILGAWGTAVAEFDTIRANERFAGQAGLNAIARRIATVTPVPFDTVLADMERRYGLALRVHLGSGIFLTLAGGLLTVAGGILSLLWAKRQKGRASERRLAEGDAGV